MMFNLSYYDVAPREDMYPYDHRTDVNLLISLLGDAERLSRDGWEPLETLHRWLAID